MELIDHVGAFLVAQMVKNLPAMEETQVWPLGWEDLPGEGNGYPLQYSCLENPLDRGTWWATYSAWGCKELNTTEWLNWTELNIRDKFKKSSESNTMDLSSYHEQLWKVKVLLTQSCPTLCNPVNSSPTGSSVPGISQAGIPEWLAIPFSRESSQCRAQTQVSSIAGRFFTIWVTRKAHQQL